MNAADALLQNTRAEQRRLKLQEAEREQQAEELEALKITEEQLNILKQPFRNVKFEFWDLDGLNWTKSSLYTRQYRAAVPLAGPADTTPATVTVSNSTPHTSSSSNSSSPVHSTSSSSQPSPQTQGSFQHIDPTQTTKSSPSLNDYDSQATIRVKPSKPRARKPLARVYSSNEIQLENAVPVPSLGAQGHSASTTKANSAKGSPHPDSSATPPNPSSSPSTSSPENHPSPKPASTRCKHSSSKLRLAGAAIALAKGQGSGSLRKANDGGVGLGLRVKEPGSPGPMRDLDFNSNFNSAFCPSNFSSSVGSSDSGSGLPSMSAFLDTSDLLSASLLSSSSSSAALLARLGDPSSYLSPSSSSSLSDSDSASTKTYSTPPTPRFGAFDSFDTSDSPGDFDFDLPHIPSHPKSGSHGEGEESMSVREAMKREVFNCLMADEIAYRTTGKFDPRPTPGSTPTWRDSPFLSFTHGSGGEVGSGHGGIVGEREKKGERGGWPEGMDPPLKLGFAERTLKDLYEGMEDMLKNREDRERHGPEAWAKKMGEEEEKAAERRREREARRAQRRQERERRKEEDGKEQGSGRGRDVYSAQTAPSPSSKESIGSLAAGLSLMDVYASLVEERTAARNGVGRHYGAPVNGSGASANARGCAGGKAEGEGYSYTSPDIAYEDMLQDNSAAFYGVGRGVYDVTPANSCPPSPAPERYEFVY